MCYCGKKSLLQEINVQHNGESRQDHRSHHRYAITTCWTDSADDAIGSNTGIGFYTAKNLLSNSEKYHVIIGSRDADKGIRAVEDLKAFPDMKGTISSVQLEVTDGSSITRAAQDIERKFGRLDTLVNNAGVCPTDGSFTDNLKTAVDVNLIGAVAVTEGFKHLLQQSKAPRIVFVSSSMGSISQAADPESRYYASGSGQHVSEYRISKAALSMTIVELGKQYANEGGNFSNLKVLGADPGANQTNLMGPGIKENPKYHQLPKPDVGAEAIASVARGDHDDKAGRVIGSYGISPW